MAEERHDDKVKSAPRRCMRYKIYEHHKVIREDGEWCLAEDVEELERELAEARAAAALHENAASHCAQMVVDALPSAELALIDPAKQKPDRDALLLTSSKVWIIGDWYQGAWRTHRSAWVNHDGTNVLTSAFRTEDIIGWLPLPIRPDAGWYRRKIAEIGDAEPHVIGVPSASVALNDNCWKCGRHFTVGRFECRESPCGAIVDKDGNVTAKIGPTDSRSAK